MVFTCLDTLNPCIEKVGVPRVQPMTCFIVINKKIKSWENLPSTFTMLYKNANND